MSAFRYLPMETLTLVALVGLAAASVSAVPALLRGDTRAATMTAARVLLAGTVLGVLAVTLPSGEVGTGVNLTPGAGIRSALSNPNRSLGMLNLAGNVLMYLPVGFLAVVTTPLGFRRVVAGCFSLSVALELLQLSLGRSLDVDDVLLNTFGGIAGATTGVALAAWLRSRERSGARK